jgi:hypothetical protein
MFASDKPFELADVGQNGSEGGETAVKQAEASELVCPTVTRTLSVATLYLELCTPFGDSSVLSFLVRNSFCSSTDWRFKRKQAHVSDVLHLLPSVQHSSTTDSTEIQHILIAPVILTFLIFFEDFYFHFTSLSLILFPPVFYFRVNSHPFQFLCYQNLTFTFSAPYNVSHFVDSHPNQLSIPAVARSKALVFCLSPAGSSGSNPAGGTDVCLLWV